MKNENKISTFTQIIRHATMKLTRSAPESSRPPRCAPPRPAMTSQAE